MIRHTLKFWLSVVVLAFFPAVVYANAGTAFIWPAFFHLFLGNALIGIAEGLVLAILFRRNAFLCMAIMIVANYFSAWAGGVFLFRKLTAHLSLDLNNAWQWTWGMAGILYVITLLLEWPFVALCLRKSESWFRKSIWGTLVVQSASYSVLFGLYWSASATSLYTDLAVVQPPAISLPEGVTLYYIAENDEDVWAIDLCSGESRRIGAVGYSTDRSWLFLRESRTTAGHWDLVAGLQPEDPNIVSNTVLADLTCTTAEAPRAEGHYDEVRRFPADTSGWQFSVAGWSGRLYGENAKEERSVNVALSTPFVIWVVRCPTQLPNGQVVFQLGANQICLLDPDERTIALVAKGRCPIVTVSDGTE